MYSSSLRSGSTSFSCDNIKIISLKNYPASCYAERMWRQQMQSMAGERTDRRTDDGQIDPYVVLFLAGATKK